MGTTTNNSDQTVKDPPCAENPMKWEHLPEDEYDQDIWALEGETFAIYLMSDWPSKGYWAYTCQSINRFEVSFKANDLEQAQRFAVQAITTKLTKMLADLATLEK